MADDKKGDKKKSAPSQKLFFNAQTLTGLFGELFVIILILLFVLKLLSRGITFIADFFQNRGFVTGSSGVNTFLNQLFYFIGSTLLFLTITSNIISVALLMGIVYALIRLTELNKAENEKFKQAMPSLVVSEKQENKAWQRITDHINSENPSDWRLAILEADIMLDELLNKIGCVGSSIGEKLQQVEKSDFNTIENAWEAHKVRNSIAHEGQGFLLTKREAGRVIRLFESVFKEFHML